MPFSCSFSLFESRKIHGLLVSKHLISHSLFQNQVINDIKEYAIFLIVQPFSSREIHGLLVSKHFISHSLFENPVIHDIKEYTISLLVLSFLNSRNPRTVGLKNFSSHTVCFKIDSLTTSKSMPFSCLFSLFKVKKSTDC